MHLRVRALIILPKNRILKHYFLLVVVVID